MSNNIEITIQGQYGTPTNEQVFAADGTINLLVDIEKAVSIPRGEALRIPTPILIRGDRRTIALLDVAAGRRPGVDDGSCMALIPNDEEPTRLEVLVVNETPGSLMIQPNYTLGTLTFKVVETAGVAEEDAVDERQDARLHVPIHFEPLHFPADMRPEYATAGAAAFDLRADVPEALTLKPGQRSLVPTGLRMEIPEGFEGQIRPRSGLALKHGISITNSPATIDSDYRGPIGVVLHNLGHEDFVVEPGDRIAQFLFAPVMTAAMDFRSDLSESGRGAGGFGSTGRS